MNWTREQPTQFGWYWFSGSSNEGEIRIVEVVPQIISRGKLTGDPDLDQVHFTGKLLVADGSQILELEHIPNGPEGAMWYGPLEKPVV